VARAGIEPATFRCSDGSDCGTSSFVLVRPDTLDQQADVSVVPRLTADNRRTDFVAQPRGWTRCTTPASCIGMARRDAAFATVPTHHVNGLLTSGGDPQRHTVDSAGAQLRKQRHRPRAELRPRHVDRAPSTSTGSPRTTSSTPTSRSSRARRSLDGFATIDHVRGGGTSPRSVTRAGVGLIRGRCVPAAQREDR
jgi:hypothetical protein